MSLPNKHDAQAEYRAQIEEIQKEHFEETGEWLSLEQIINDYEFDKDVDLSMDDNS